MTTSAKQKSVAWVVLIVTLVIPAAIALAYVSYWVTRGISEARADEIIPNSQFFDSGPYATSREEAMRTRMKAFFAMKTLSVSDVTRILSVTGEESGEKVRIVPWHTLEAEVWQGLAVRYGVVVIPSDQVTWAEKWEIKMDEKILEVFLISKGKHYFNWGIKRLSYTTALACSTSVERIPINVARAT